jgi:hypothetical protein
MRKQNINNVVMTVTHRLVKWPAANTVFAVDVNESMLKELVYDLCLPEFSGQE